MKITSQTLADISTVNYEVTQALKRYINANISNKMSAFKILPCKFLLDEDFLNEEDFLEQEMNQQDYVGLRNVDYLDGDVHYTIYGEANGNEFEYSFYTHFDNLLPYINKKFV